jgi:hypothetical protein
MPIDIPSSDELLRRTRAIQAGADYLRDLARSRAPFLTGRLRESIQSAVTSDNSATVYTRLVYAPKQERRDWQRHTHGGMAHYLRSAFETGTDEAMNRIAQRLFQE